jgi:streptogramin lyase
VVLPVALAVGPASGATVDCTGSTDRVQLVECVREHMPEVGDGFARPFAQQWSDLASVMASMLAGQTVPVLRPSLRGIMAARAFDDAGTGRTHALLMEVADADGDGLVDRGFGTFLVDPAAVRELSIAVAHPIYDPGTRVQGIEVFRAVGARSFLMAGTHRNASAEVSACQPSYQESDAAHNADLMFLAGTQALIAHSGARRWHQIQFHGLGSRPCPETEVFVLHGDQRVPPAAGGTVSALIPQPPRSPADRGAATRAPSQPHRTAIDSGSVPQDFSPPMLEREGRKGRTMIMSMRRGTRSLGILARGSVLSLAAALAALSAVAGMPINGNVLVQGAPIPGTFGLRFGPDGNLYVASIGAGIVVVDPETGQVVGLLGPEQGVVGPEDLAFGPDGSLYWSEMFVGTVGRRAPDGIVTHQMVGPGINPLAFDSHGRLFATVCWFADLLVELDPNLVNPPRPVLDGLGWFKGIAFGPDGLLYGASVQSGKIVRIDVNAVPPTVETVATGFAAPFVAKFDSQGRLVVLDRGAAKLYRVFPSSGSRQLIVALPFGADNVAIGPGDRIFLSSYSDACLVEVTAGGELRWLLPGGMIFPTTPAVVERPDGESVFVGNIMAMREFDGATGAPRGTVRQAFLPPPAFTGAWTVNADRDRLVLTTLFPVPGVQVFDAGSSSVVADYRDLVMPVNAVFFQGDLVVAELGMAQGEARVTRLGASGRTTLADITTNLFAPTGLASSGGNLWVSDWATGMVWQLAADGVQLAPPRPVATGLAGPEGLAVDRDGSLLVVEAGAARLSRIQPLTGAASVVAGGLALGTPGFGVLPPFGFVNGVAVGPSGAIYVAGDAANVLYKLTPRTYILPAAASRAGLAGSAWKTELGIHNRGPIQAGYTIELLETGKPNPAPRTASFALAPQSSARYPDVLRSAFDFEGSGALRITTVGGELVVTSCTVNEQGGAAAGQFVAGEPIENAIATTQEARIVHLSNAAGRRTNIGITNASAVPIEVLVDLFRADGGRVGSRTFMVPPSSHLQQSDVFSHLTSLSVSAHALSTIDDAYAVLRSPTPGALYFAYGSVVDNRSGSPIHVPAR